MFHFVIALCLCASAAGTTAAEAPSVSIAFRLDEADLIPEGIAYDPQTRQFFLSSIHKAKVLAVSETGVASDFIKSGQDGVLGSLGMKVDAGRRRLWVLSNRDEGGRHLSAIHVFHIDSRTCLKNFVLDQASPQLLNDLALSPDGSAHVTDTKAGRVYAVSADLSRLALCVESADLLKDANGITLSPENGLLYVAANSWITIIDPQTGAMSPAGNPAGLAKYGIDGLVPYRGDLIGIVNEVSRVEDIHIARYRLSPDGKDVVGVTVIDKGNPLFNIPTTCVVVGDSLYCLANTSLGIYLSGRMKDKDQLQRPTVLKYPLRDR